MPLFGKTWGNTYKVFCGLKGAVWNCRRILANSYVSSGNISESIRILDWKTQRLSTVMNVPGWFENYMREGRLEFSADAGSKKPDSTQGRDFRACTMGKHRVQLKWSFMTHPSMRKTGWQGTRNGCLRALIMVTQLTKHPLVLNCEIN